MFVKTYQKTHGARTLSPKFLGFDNKTCWTIKGQVTHDYYSWVNDFEAYHPALGTVSGNFEREVIADSEYAFNEFIKHYPPTEWDYGDI